MNSYTANSGVISGSVSAGSLTVAGATTANVINANAVNVVNNVQASRLVSTVAVGTAPLAVASTTLNANLNAALLNGQTQAFFQNSSNINAGILAVLYGGTGVTTSTGSTNVVLSASPTLTGVPTVNGVLAFANNAQNCLISLSGPTTSASTAYSGFGFNTNLLRYQTDAATTDHAFYTNTTELLRIKGNGFVGINQSSPSYNLDVTGTVNASTLTRSANVLSTVSGGGPVWSQDGAGTFYGFRTSGTVMQIGQNVGGVPTGMTLDAGGNCTITGVFAQPGGGLVRSTSDLRLKSNVATLQGSLDKVCSLRGVSFGWKVPDVHTTVAENAGGFIAQEVAEVFPEFVGQKVVESELERQLVGGETCQTVDMSLGFVGHLVEAIKELRNEMRMLRSVSPT